MFCIKCGNQLPDTAKFCTKCGTPVKRVDNQPLGMTNVSQGVNETPDMNQSTPVKKAKAAKTPKPERPAKPTGEKSSNNKIIITVMGLVIVCLIVVIALLFSKDFFNKDKSDSVNSQVTTVSDDNNTSSKSNKNKDKETKSSTEAETESTDNSEYVIADSDTRLLTREDLVGLNQEQLRIARNELYARHGRKFNDEALQSYFDSKSWYKGTIEPNDFTDDMLTETELKNKDTIVSYEEEMNYR